MGAPAAQPLLRAVRMEDHGETGFPWDLPAVRSLAARELELHPEVTFLVGENGSGKSTLVEAIAAKLDLDAEGGDVDRRFDERVADSDLHSALRLERGPRRPSMRYFLRAESFFNVARTVDAHEGLLARHGGRPLHEMSHGESFLALVNERFYPDGLFVLDEPEAALSFTSCLALVGILDRLARAGGQVLCATHSPLLTALPGATVLQLGDGGIEPVDWQDLDLVDHWRRYLGDPRAYLRHVLE